MYQSPFGYIYYELSKHGLTSMYFSDDDEHITDQNNDINKQLQKYFEKELKSFDVSIFFDHGTSFQKEVWNALLKVPFGETRSYKEIAESIHRPKAVRAVGQACKRNPIGLIVPCHRIIGSDGSMTGYSGKNYIYLKEKLLNHERS
jgi:O-6-methylguanine DNA methyltransferase